MSLVVLKFGGTSLGNTSRIRGACEIVKRHVDAGDRVIIVVSAMGGITDQLVSLIRDVSPEAPSPSKADEHDVVLSSGENVSAGLVAMALGSMGVRAKSWLGWQLPIKVSGEHSDADIESIGTEDLKKCLEFGIVPVVAGFQGERDNKIFTLGRGGTDTTAVAVANALEADKCYIYTDVDGVFTSDPRIIPKVQKLDKISFGEMYELAENGAKVLHPKAVKIAWNAGVNVEVLSSFTSHPGTIVGGQEIKSSELVGIAVKPLEDGVQICLVGAGFTLSKYNLDKIHEIIKHEGADVISESKSDTSLKLVLNTKDVISIAREIHSQFGLDVSETKNNQESKKRA